MKKEEITTLLARCKKHEKMKYLLIITAYFCLITNTGTAQITDVPTAIVSGYFDEIREATHPYYALWDKDLYGEF
jgi:hypothetical protein